MLTSRYMTSVKNLSAILNKIVEGTAPEKFTIAHLKGLGFKSSNDQGVLPILKDLGFLTADGTPTPRYLEYRDRSKSRAVLGQALRDAYGELFHINEKPTDSDRAAIEGKFKSVHNATDRIAKEQAKTFFALLELADLDGKHPIKKAEREKAPKDNPSPTLDKPRDIDPTPDRGGLSFGGLRYNIEIHLPATKDVEVFNSIFKSLKEHLLED